MGVSVWKVALAALNNLERRSCDDALVYDIVGIRRLSPYRK